MYYHQKLGNAIESGISSGCPFCKATMLGVPKPGDFIRILAGYTAGMVVEVVDNHNNIPLRSGEFLVRYENDLPGYTNTIILEGRERTLFEYLPPSPIPDWAPPICLRHAGELDRLINRLWGISLRGDCSFDPFPTFFELITYIWYHRLPLEAEELWKVLEAHGFPLEWKNRLMQFYQEGKDLLIYAAQRKPFKNRRVEPLSVNCKCHKFW